MKHSITYKEGRVWSNQTVLGQIDKAVANNQNIYAGLCKKDGRTVEIVLDCTNSESASMCGEGFFEIGNITEEWEVIRQELAQQKMPSGWMAVVTQRTEEIEKGKCIMEERNEIFNQAANNTADEAGEKACTDAAEENNIEIAENHVSNATEPDEQLPPVSGDTPYAVLARKGKYQLNMQVCGDMETMMSEGCKLYLTDTETGKLYISSSSEITIPRARLLSAADHSVMNVLSSYLVDFTEDDKKLAFERAKLYIEAGTKITKTSSSRNIQDILGDVVKLVKTKSVQSSGKDGDGMPSDTYKYDEAEGTVAVITGQFQKLLDEVDAGCTKTVFCKKIRMLEQHYGKEIIISNRGGSGYGFNDTNNRRYYKFKITEGIV